MKPQLELLEKLHKRGIISTETFVKANTAEYDKLIKQVFPNLKMGFMDGLKGKFYPTCHQSHQAYLKTQMVVEKNAEMMDRLSNAA